MLCFLLAALVVHLGLQLRPARPALAGSPVTLHQEATPAPGVNPGERGPATPAASPVAEAVPAGTSSTNLDTLAVFKPTAPGIAPAAPTVSTEAPRTSGESGPALRNESSSLQLPSSTADARLIGLLGGELFAPGQVTVNPRDRDAVRSIAKRLTPMPAGSVVLIEGHTDSQPIRSDTTGPAKDNSDLSRQRALAVAELLVEEGVPKSALRVRGWGDSRPLDSRHDTAGAQARNRRVEILLLPAAGY